MLAVVQALGCSKAKGGLVKDRSLLLVLFHGNGNGDEGEVEVTSWWDRDARQGYIHARGVNTVWHKEEQAGDASG